MYFPKQQSAPLILRFQVRLANTLSLKATVELYLKCQASVYYVVQVQYGQWTENICADNIAMNMPNSYWHLKNIYVLRAHIIMTWYI